MIRLISGFFYGGLFILPWVWWPSARVPYEVPKVWFLDLWVAVMAGMTCAVFLRDRQLPRYRVRLMIPLLLYWLWVLATSLTGSDWMKSLQGNYYRNDGLIALTALLGIALIVGWWKLSATSLLNVLAWVNVSVSVIAVTVWLYVRSGGNVSSGWGGMVWDKDIGLAFGNPHFLAGFLVVTLPALLIQWGLTGGRIRIFWAFTAALCHVAIAATGSYLSIAMIGIVWLLWWGIRHKRFVGVTVSGLAIFLAVTGWWVFKPSVTFDAHSRGRLWRRLMMAVPRRPVTGYGLANVDHALEGTVWPYPVRFDVYVDKAHASLMEVLATSGLVGLGIYGWLWFTAGRMLYRSVKQARNEERIRHQGRLLLLLVWFTQSQLNVLSIVTEVVGWIVLGTVLQEQ